MKKQTRKIAQFISEGFGYNGKGIYFYVDYYPSGSQTRRRKVFKGEPEAAEKERTMWKKNNLEEFMEDKW
jgi:hypothetical protein